MSKGNRDEVVTSAGTDRSSQPDGKAAASAFRPGTRQAQVLDLLCRESGADLDEMMDLTGWQAHSVRAVLTGFRRRGIEVVRTGEGNGVSVYRVAR
ncbi:MAG: DUF3489 domain-containing protein [Pseudomonadota bacterium]|nr:DUF3489 domain-containing protein [Pseudomonadota bacterium]